MGGIFKGLMVDRKQRNVVRRFLWVLIGAAVLSGCAETKLVMYSAKRIIGTSELESVGKNPPEYKIGEPYQIAGVWYYPQEDFEYDESGIASWYGAKFHGRLTANSETYDMNSLTAAHRTLPMPSFVRVTNLENGRSLVLRVNDRGPFARGRIIDISRRGAQLLGFEKQGTARVRVQVLADRTRALKSRIRNQVELAKVGTPITIDRQPKAKVESQLLPPPEKSGIAEPVVKVSNEPRAPVTSRPEMPKIDQARDRAVSAREFELNGQVTQTRKVKTSIYIQAGAFGMFDNANRVRARLAPLGQVNLSQILVNGKDLYRVRLGPLENVDQADQVLIAVGEAGFKDAKIIVD